MITKREANKYKKTIGKNYIRKTLEFFKLKGYTRASGKPYIGQDIINVMCGARQDMSLEFYIIEVVEHYQSLADTLKKKKNKVLNNKKPKAATLGS